MNLLYATTGSINTAALISTERKQRLRSEKHRGFGMRILGFFQLRSSIRQQCMCSRDMSCQLHPRIRAQQLQAKEGQHAISAHQRRVWPRDFNCHVNCDFSEGFKLRLAKANALPQKPAPAKFQEHFPKIFGACSCTRTSEAAGCDPAPAKQLAKG